MTGPVVIRYVAPDHLVGVSCTQSGVEVIHAITITFAANIEIIIELYY